MADLDKMKLSMAGKRADDSARPCPFCGSEEIAYGKYEHAAGERYAILCMNCMAQIDPGWAQSWGAVQELWNRRAGKDTNVTTNADRIRSMSDEELAEFLRNIRDCGDYDELKFIGGVRMDYVSVIEWLKQPAKEEI